MFWNRYAERVLMLTTHNRLVLVKPADQSKESISRENLEKVGIIGDDRFRLHLKDNTITFRCKDPISWKLAIDKEFR